MTKRTSFSFYAFFIGVFLVTCVVAFWRGGYFKSGGEASVHTLKLAHGLDATHPVHLGMLHMQQRIAELSDGKLRLDIYAGGALGEESQSIEQLRNGSLDMTKASAAAVGTFIPEIQVLTLPYLFRDKEHYWKALDSQTGEKILGFLEMRNLVGLCFYDAGSRSFYTKNKQIKTVDDLKGMKIRVMSSATDNALMAYMGASATPISSGELYTALSQGSVDGAENNFPTFLTSAHYEICKYMTLDEHTSIPDMLIIGKRTWNKLTPAQREIVKQAAHESSLYQRELWAQKTAEARRTLEEKGVIFYTPDKSSFKEKAQLLYEDFKTEDKYRKGSAIHQLSEEIKAIR